MPSLFPVSTGLYVWREMPILSAIFPCDTYAFALNTGISFLNSFVILFLISAVFSVLEVFPPVINQQNTPFCFLILSSNNSLA